MDTLETRRNIFLQGSTIYLRAFEEADLEGNYKYWFNDAEVTRQMVKGALPATKPQLANYYREVVESSTNLILAIVDNNSNRHIGNIGLHDINYMHQSAELGICIGEKPFWGKGIGKGAIALLCKHAFMQLNLRRIELGVFASHTSGIRSYEAAGFKREGLKRSAIYKDGQWEDIVTMGMLKNELNLSLLDD
jgi:ribosomal-protein-alanine N-acetyltransferase